ncbi:hypothetical protein KUCAC02_024339 [Chaenocephalus aceratus]|uniref:Uncharacterized protein n=1 Tax=Chaenocephalus aceratus TaxID=36190 RepID=A0ACB9WJ64_CHAAC|nr:hypothetical protein KUCAC02_024339 [Chaenocephalus aceratus]
MAGKLTAAQGTGILLVTANVGSLFEDVGSPNINPPRTNTWASHNHINKYVYVLKYFVNTESPSSSLPSELIHNMREERLPPGVLSQVSMPQNTAEESAQAQTSRGVEMVMLLMLKTICPPSGLPRQVQVPSQVTPSVPQSGPPVRSRSPVRSPRQFPLSGPPRQVQVPSQVTPSVLPVR